MVGTSANLFGVGLGFLVPKMFISIYDESEVYTQDQIDQFSNQILLMLVVISAVSTAIALLCLAKFKEKPPIVPP